MSATCTCTLRERLLGDGCPVCNSELARELAEDRAREDAELRDDPSRYDHEREDHARYGAAHFIGGCD